MEEQRGRRAVMGALRCASAPGRRLEELNAVFSSRMLALLKDPTQVKAVGLSLHVVPRVAGSLFLLRVLWALINHKRRTARENLRKQKISADSPSALDMQEDAPPESVQAPYKRKPRWLDLLRVTDGGWPSLDMPDIAAMILTSYFSTLVQIRIFHEVAALHHAQTLNRRGLWFVTALKFVPLFGAQGALSVASSFFYSRLVLHWRGTVTRKLHSLYFSNMSYYRVISSPKEIRVGDPDIRISCEVEGVCHAYTGFLTRVCSAVFMNIALRDLWEGGNRGGAAARGAPKTLVSKGSEWVGVLFRQALPVVCATHIPLLVLNFWWTALDPKWTQERREVASSKYMQAIARAQAHADHVCALRGEAYEAELLGRRLDGVAYWSRLTHRAWSATNYASTLIESDLGCQVSGGQLAASLGTCLAIAGRFQRQRGTREPGATAVFMPNSEVAETVGALSMEPTIQLVSLVNFISLVGLIPGLLLQEASATRVLELFARLREANEAALLAEEDAAEAPEEGGSAVAFEGVAVETPDGHRLVDDLTFRVGLGETLLIVGHNGAGKSSIMRCLCGLWPVAAGKVARPGARGEHEGGLDTYYLPQKPINVIGSLSDQLTYPVRLPGGLPRDELRRWLRYVGLEHLAERDLAEGGEAMSINWDEILSLGEQQALSIARLLYHRPRFAILDECTSATSKAMERRLFGLAHALGVACITIAHRPALQEHHDRMLRLTGTLEQDGHGWKMEELPRGRSRVQPAAHCGSTEEAHVRIARVLAEQEEETAAASCASLPAVAPADGPPEARQRGETAGAEADGRPGGAHDSEVRRRWPSAAARFAALLRLGLGEGGGRRRIAFRAIAMAGLACVRCRMVWELLAIVSSARRRALIGDAIGVGGELFGAMLAHPLATAAEHHFKMQTKALCCELSRNAGSALLRRALGQGLVLRVLRPTSPDVPAVEDALQRIADVQPLFNDQGAELLHKALPMLLAIYLLPTLVGAGGPGALVVLAGGLCLIKVSQRAAPDRSHLQRRQDELEARFRSRHARVMRFSEAIAFSGGGEDERGLVEPQLDAVIAFRRKALRDRLLYDWIRSSFLSKVPDCVQKLLSLNFSNKNIPAGLTEVSPAIASASLLYEMVAYTAMRAQDEALNLEDLCARLDGRAVRILELSTALDAAEAAGAAAGAAADAEPDGDCLLRVRGLDLVAPGGARLARKVDFDLMQGLPMLVTGPNGCGKSLLFSTILGTLPASGPGAQVALRGAGAAPGALGQLLMAAPQRVYLPLGTLGDQVCYPQSYRPPAGSGEDGAPDPREEAMLAALRSAGLEHLLRREQHGWLAHRVWEDVLSGGEQQRMALARIFFGRPRLALLDECTSMVASDAEESLYHALFDAGITPLTLSQRLFMPALYKWELGLGAPTPDGWAMTRTFRGSEEA